MSQAFNVFSLLLIAFSLTGCATRGAFVPKACPDSAYTRLVDGNAVSAIYYDIDTHPIGKEENLDGTYFKWICGSTAINEHPVPCACGTCDTVVKQKHYCLSCTTNPCPPQ